MDSDVFGNASGANGADDALSPLIASLTRPVTQVLPSHHLAWDAAALGDVPALQAALSSGGSIEEKDEEVR